MTLFRKSGGNVCKDPGFHLSFEFVVESGNQSAGTSDSLRISGSKSTVAPSKSPSFVRLSWLSSSTGAACALANNEMSRNHERGLFKRQSRKRSNISQQ